MSPNDVFIDGGGPHSAGGTLNVPLTTGGSGLPPVLFIEDFLKTHIPKLNLPIPFELMSPEDKSHLLKKFVIELDNGRTTNMAEVLRPVLGRPNWKSYNPQDLNLPEEFLKSKVKKMWLEVCCLFVSHCFDIVSVVPYNSFLSVLRLRGIPKLLQRDLRETKIHTQLRLAHSRPGDTR